MIHKAKAFALIFFAAATLTSAAPGQTNSMKQFEMMMADVGNQLSAACAAEVEAFCSTVNPGDGRTLLCVMAHHDQLTVKCGTAILDTAIALGNVLGFIQYAANACQPDIVNVCGGIVLGGGEVAECLINNKTAVSAQCSEAISAFENPY